MSDIDEKPLVLTAGLMREFFEARGMNSLHNCPKCNQEDFDDNDPDERIYTTYSREFIAKTLEVDRVNNQAFGVFSRNCDNCGYFDSYYLTPLVRYWLDKNG